MHVTLRKLMDSEEWQAHGAFVATAEALYAVLGRSDAVGEVRKSIRSEAIGEGDVRQFVSEILTDLEKGFQFPHETVLAALVVALEPFHMSWAEKFMDDLSELKIREMPMAPRVARRCRARRKWAVMNHHKEKRVGRTVAGNGFEWAQLTEVVSKHLVESQEIELAGFGHG